MGKNKKLSEAMKGNQNALGNEGGRPTEFKSEFIEQAYNYCLLGATDKQLGDFFNVSEQTINTWKQEYPEFLESLHAGKELADIKVAKSMYNACLGAVVKKQKEVRVKKVDPETKKLVDDIKIVDLVEQLPGDVNAMKFWLTNRQKDNWANRHDHTTKGKEITDHTFSYTEKRADD